MDNKMNSNTTTFEEILSRDGMLVYKIRGVSMLPMLRQNRDLVVIGQPGGRLKPYDTALYRRGSSYVLHRVIRVTPEGYLIRGDNTYALENVPDQAVIGVLTSFVRDGKKISVTDRKYLAYVRFWCAIYPLRAGYVRVRRKVAKIPLARKIYHFLKK